MSVIDPTGRLLVNLRLQADELRKKHPGLATNAGQSSRSRSQANKDPLSLATGQILLIDRRDPRAPRHAFKIYLTCVLAREFGMGITNDPGFAGLVDQVERAMEGDVQLLKALHEAGEHLIRTVHESGAP